MPIFTIQYEVVELYERKVAAPTMDEAVLIAKQFEDEGGEERLDCCTRDYRVLDEDGRVWYEEEWA